ncbi:MAG: DUF547 domain-containing protein [Betaproteobacteria bacterium]
MKRFATALLALLLVAVPFAARAQAFDHGHKAWDALVKKHVVLLQGGKASQVRYAGMSRDRAALKAYLDSLSGVTEAQFNAWSKAERMAFLINAYNAFTVEKVLTRYPNLKSIRDFGSVFGNPWKDKFFKLLGRESYLDQVEHEMLRKPGAYDEPRVHFAVNCASIGCPMLREAAFVAPRLEAQLDEQALRFMSDRSRNRYNAAAGKLEVSKIFDWYGVDFKQGYKGIDSLTGFCARYAEQLADAPAAQERVKAQKAPIDFLEYDWQLNDVR